MTLQLYTTTYLQTCTINHSHNNTVHFVTYLDFVENDQGWGLNESSVERNFRYCGDLYQQEFCGENNFGHFYHVPDLWIMKEFWLRILGEQHHSSTEFSAVSFSNIAFTQRLYSGILENAFAVHQFHLLFCSQTIFESFTYKMNKQWCNVAKMQRLRTSKAWRWESVFYKNNL